VTHASAPSVQVIDGQPYMMMAVSVPAEQMSSNTLQQPMAAMKPMGALQPMAMLGMPQGAQFVHTSNFASSDQWAPSSEAQCWPSEDSAVLPHSDKSATRRRRRQRAVQQDHRFRPLLNSGSSTPDSVLAHNLIELLSSEGQNASTSIVAAVDILREEGVVRRLAFQPAGCRAVQKALEVVDRKSAVQIAYCFQGIVSEAIKSPHANFVVQKIIQELSSEEVRFVVEEISEASLDFACHEYGCRIYCRLLENAAGDAPTSRLVDELLLKSDQLIQRIYGHYVVEAIVEHGLPAQQRLVVELLCKDMFGYSRSCHGAHVVEKALESSDDRQLLVEKLLALPADELAALARGKFSGMVLRALQRVSQEVAEKTQELLRSSSQPLRSRGPARRHA